MLVDGSSAHGGSSPGIAVDASSARRRLAPLPANGGRRGSVTATIDERPSPTEKLRYEIDLLDAHDVRQGDEAIWQFPTTAWTPDLVDRFVEHDDPWRIRRWWADLRKAGE